MLSNFFFLFSFLRILIGMQNEYKNNKLNWQKKKKQTLNTMKKVKTMEIRMVERYFADDSHI